MPSGAGLHPISTCEVDALGQTKTDGDSKFVGVTDGSVVPKTTGAAFNSALAGAVWDTKGG